MTPRAKTAHEGLGIVHRARAFLLDVDGTLVDSNDQHARAWCEALEKEGFDAPYKVVRKLIGMGGDKLCPRMTGCTEDSRAGKKITAARTRIFRKKHLSTIQPFRGSRELVQALRDAGKVVRIASSADRKDLRRLLEIAKVADLIEDDSSSAEVRRSKPDPEIVKTAMRGLRVPKRAALMVGDTPYDIEAAALAGIRTIAFRCGGGWADRDLTGALAIYDGPWELAQALT